MRLTFEKLLKENGIISNIVHSIISPGVIPRVSEEYKEYTLHSCMHDLTRVCSNGVIYPATLPMTIFGSSEEEIENTLKSWYTQKIHDLTNKINLREDLLLYQTLYSDLWIAPFDEEDCYGGYWNTGLILLKRKI